MPSVTSTLEIDLQTVYVNILRNVPRFQTYVIRSWDSNQTDGNADIVVKALKGDVFTDGPGGFNCTLEIEKRQGIKAKDDQILDTFDDDIAAIEQAVENPTSTGNAEAYFSSVVVVEQQNSEHDLGTSQRKRTRTWSMMVTPKIVLPIWNGR